MVFGQTHCDGVWTDALRWCLDRQTHCFGRNTLSFCCSCRTSPCRVFVAVWAVNVFRFSLANCRPKDRLFSLSCFSKFWKQYIFQLLCSQRGVMKLDCNETSYIYDRCKFQHDFSPWLSGQTLVQNKMKHRAESPRSRVGRINIPFQPNTQCSLQTMDTDKKYSNTSWRTSKYNQSLNMGPKCAILLSL